MARRLRLPRIVELCNRHASAPECGEYLLMAGMIPPSQQVSPPVTDNKVKHGCLLGQKCSVVLQTKIPGLVLLSLLIKECPVVS